jgi:uncharacterized protein
MNSYLKYKPAWLQLIIFGSITIGIALALIFISLLVISKVYNVSIIDIGSMNLNNIVVLEASKALQAASTIALFGAPALVFGYLSHQKPLQYLGFTQPQPAIMWLPGIILLLVALPAVAWVSDINQHLHLPKNMGAIEKWMRDTEGVANKTMRRFLTMKSTGQLIQMIIIIALLPALAEELFFRGVLQRLFIHIFKNAWAGIIFTAIIFSAIHGQFLGFLPRLLLGILLGVTYWYSGSLWPGIIAHFINNAIQVILVYKNPNFIEKEVNFTAPLVLASMLATVVIIFFIKRISHTRYAEVYDTDDDDDLRINGNHTA